MKNKKTAHRYANALLGMANDKKLLDRIYNDVLHIHSIIGQSADFNTFLKNPIITTIQKKNTFKALFEKTLSKETLDFIFVLCTKGREDILDEVIVDFMALHDEQKGIIKAEVVSVVDLDSKQIEVLTGKLAAFSGKSPRLSFRKDPQLIGGFLVRLGDTVIDGSVKRQLERLREQFSE
ncbi:ATP synthase F1 subunit delta [bacterium]|nr:ATP synthase F1 subunit delta [bacterium]